LAVKVIGRAFAGVASSAWDRIVNVGMVPREDAGKPQSSAIFGSRRTGTKAKTTRRVPA
jgi:hypothetical protein